MNNLLLLLCFSSSVLAYIPNSGVHFGFAQARPSWAYEGGENTDKGGIMIEYDVASNVMTYYVALQQAEFGNIGLYGPANCQSRSLEGAATGSYTFYTYRGINQADVNCIYNVGERIRSLGNGPPTGSKLVSGTVTLTDAEEIMLFDRSLYVRFDTEARPDGFARGAIVMYDGGANVWFQKVFLKQNNNNKFGSGQFSSSNNVAFGFIAHSVGSSSLSYNIWNDIEQPGALLMQCGDQGQNIRAEGSQHFTGSVSFPAEKTDMLFKMKSPDNCFFYIRSAEYNDGELFGETTNLAQYEMLASQSGVNVSAFAVLDYDETKKRISIMIEHNISPTELIGVHVHSGSAGQDGPVVCALTNELGELSVQTSCFLYPNSTSMINNENLYINFHTNAAPNGLIRGQIQKTGALATPGLSSGAVAGIAVGATVVGLLVLGALGFVGYLGYKKGFSSSRI